MRVIIVEDENPAAEKLAKQLQAQAEDIQIVDRFDSVDDAVDWLKANEAPDLMFLDIHLADGLSFDIFKEVAVNCPVVFTTAYDQYAINAFEVNSVDYLLKPVKDSQLAEALKKYRDYKRAYAKSGANEGGPQKIDVGALVQMINSGGDKYKSRFLVKNGNKIRAVKIDEVAYFFTEDKLSFLMTRAGDKFPLDYSLDEIGGMINPKSFFRINRQFIIHFDSAKEIHPYFKGRLQVTLAPPAPIKDEVIISSEKTPLFKVWLDQ